MVDYSKWKNIEISDDEDETHPNIDTPSLFRWRHQARVERMEDHKKQMEVLENKKAEHSKKLKEFKKQIEEAETNNSGDIECVKEALKNLEVEEERITKEGEELVMKEKRAPWNVDTISKEGFTKTVINTQSSRSKNERLSEEQCETRMRNFVQQNEKDLKHFGMLRRYEDSRAFLKEKNHLVCEDTANYLVIWCINLEMEDKHDLMEHVAHQTICMQYILELARQLDYDPRACLDAFFSKIQIADAEYKSFFDDELRLFKERIKKRAIEKVEEAVKEVEEEERAKRLGPGGLDPVEVFESLPEELKKCFESQDIPLLQETIAKMDESQARYHMKRCVESGLWLPEANTGKTDEESENAASR